MNQNESGGLSSHLQLSLMQKRNPAKCMTSPTERNCFQWNSNKDLFPVRFGKWLWCVWSVFLGSLFTVLFEKLSRLLIGLLIYLLRWSFSTINCILCILETCLIVHLKEYFCSVMSRNHYFTLSLTCVCLSLYRTTALKQRVWVNAVCSHLVVIYWRYNCLKINNDIFFRKSPI